MLPDDDLSERFKIPIIVNPHLPPGTALLVPDWESLGVGLDPSIRWYESPWADRANFRARYSDTFRHALCVHDGVYQHHTLAEHVESERDRGLDFLARLLDDWCTGMGLDPDRVWRQPKIRERREREDRLRWQMDARLSMSINNPRSAFVITVP